jgi:hypothetical protein
VTLLESFTRAVRVTDWVPLELSVELLTNKSILAAVGVVGVVGVAVSLLPPHPLRQQNRIKKISSNNGRENLVLIDFVILLSFSEVQMIFVF